MPAKKTAATPHRSRGTVRLALGMIVLLALVVRLIVMFESAGSAYHEPLVLDAANYHRLAVEGDPQGPFWQPPLYSWVLRGVYAAVGGARPEAMRAVQVLFGALTAGLVAWLTLRLSRRLTLGVAAGTAAALYGPSIAFDIEILPASLAAFGLTVWTALFVGPDPDASSSSGFSSSGWGRLVRAAACGLLAGTLAILLPTVVFAVGLVAVWVVKAWGWRFALVLAVFAALPVLAVSARNAQFDEGRIPISYNGGVNFFIGNNPDYPDTVGIRPGTAWNALTQQPACHGAKTRAEESSWFYAQGLQYAQSQPLRWVRDMAWKFAQSISVFEIGRNRDLYAGRDESQLLSLLMAPSGWPFALLSFAAATSLWVQTRRRSWVVPLWLVVGGFLLASVLFFPTARYRAPILPLLIVGAFVSMPHWRWRDLIAGGAAVAIGLIPTGIEPVPPAETFYEIGFELERRNDPEQAKTFYRRAMQTASGARAADVNLAYGLILMRESREREGERHLVRATELNPQADGAWTARAGLARQRGQVDRARQYLERALEANPCNWRARLSLAQLLLETGYYERAGEQLRMLQRTQPRPSRAIQRTIERYRQLTGNDPTGR